MDHVVDVLIIGAGVSGLAARRVLMRNGLSTLTLEKSNGPSGRMASHASQHHHSPSDLASITHGVVNNAQRMVYDFGAQFVSSGNKDWASVVRETQEVDPEAVNSILLPLLDAKYPRFTHRDGLKAFAYRMSGLSIERHTQSAAALPPTPSTTTANSSSPHSIIFRARVAHIRPSHYSASDGDGDGGYVVTTTSGLEHRARRVLLTPPLPQSVDILDDSPELNLDPDGIAPLRSVSYDRCIAVMIACDQEETIIPPPGILKTPKSNPFISGIFDQRAKGIKTTPNVLVIHAAPQLSLELWDIKDDEVVKNIVLRHGLDLLPAGSSMNVSLKPGASWLHRWKFCEPRNVLADKFFSVQNLVFAGDAFGASSVNGAFASGEAAALHIAKI